MNELANIIARSGILPQETLAELRKWGLPVPEMEGEPIKRPEDIVQALEMTMQSEGFVLTRETDLEILQRFLQTAKMGTLHLIADSAEGDAQVDVQTMYAVTKLGQYIIPHRGETISDIIANGKTHLEANGKRFYFKDSRELFYGEHKAFLVCSPSMTEALTAEERVDGPH